MARRTQGLTPPPSAGSPSTACSSSPLACSTSIGAARELGAAPPLRGPVLDLRPARAHARTADRFAPREPGAAGKRRPAARAARGGPAPRELRGRAGGGAPRDAVPAGLRLSRRQPRPISDARLPPAQ